MSISQAEPDQTTRARYFPEATSLTNVFNTVIMTKYVSISEAYILKLAIRNRSCQHIEHQSSETADSMGEATMHREEEGHQSLRANLEAAETGSEKQQQG